MSKATHEIEGSKAKAHTSWQDQDTGDAQIEMQTMAQATTTTQTPAAQTQAPVVGTPESAAASARLSKLRQLMRGDSDKQLLKDATE